MSPCKRFNEYVEEGIAALPEWVQSELKNVAFIVLDEPNEQQIKENKIASDETLFGLYEGVPLTERGNEPPLFPDVITIFKKPIVDAYTDENDIRKCVHNTVWHEVAHYFGHDEEWVEEEERRRGKIM